MEVKVERMEKDGKVAVLYAPGYGAGWSTWGGVPEIMLFDREIVQAVLDDDRDLAAKLAEDKHKSFEDSEVYTGGAEDLKVAWLEKGTDFRVTEYDGNESIVELYLERHFTA